MKPPAVCAFDLSIAGTGVCDTEGNAWTVKTRADGDLRLLDILDHLHKAVGSGYNQADLAVIEDLPRNAKGAGITGMVQGAVRVELMRLGMPYVLVTAASVKKYATGSGGADKVAMGVALMKRFGLEMDTHNATDSWWLRAMALDALGCPLAPMPAVNRAALDAVKWPQVGGGL